MKKYKAVIVGAGFSGICMAIKLKELGINDFVIFEKASELGGTWRENTYPGAECDIPSALYSFSFEHNDKWEFKWSGQQQILKYQNDTASKYDIDKHICFNTELTDAVYDQQSGGWNIQSDGHEPCWAQHIITGVGQLHYPFTPEYKDQSSFKGKVFHSAKWNHDCDLTGKRVAVIGNAASAVQLVPEIAKIVKSLTVYQRSANWMVPKIDRPYSKFEQKMSRKIPVVAKIYRFSIWIMGEAMILPAIKGNRFSRWLLTAWSKHNIKVGAKDPELIKKLTPDYPIGAKRILFSANYYPALRRDNVRLDTSGVESFTKNEIISKDGVREEFDVVIYATGFKTNPFLAPMKFTGLKGKQLSESWKDGAHAYLGVATSGFPNLHMMYGPNTNLGHSSILIMFEAQAKYIAQSIQGLNQQSLSSLDVKANVENTYNDEIQSRLKKLAFNAVKDSWYMDGGKITNNWAGSTMEYRRRLKNVDWNAYTLNK